jgi:hypothetical protein
MLDTTGNYYGGRTEGWRKLHEEQLEHIESSASKIKVIEGRRMRGVGMQHALDKNCIKKYTRKSRIKQTKEMWAQT